MTKTPEVVLMVGGPAAGKSTVIEREFAAWKVLDCDRFKETIPGYDPKRPELVHEQSSILCNRAVFESLGRGESFVYDSTGTNAEKLVSIIKQAQAAGYVTTVVYVTCSLSTALTRNQLRPRTVPESIVREKHALVETSFEIVSRYADRAVVVNNE